MEIRYLRAIILWAKLWDVCWWHNTENYWAKTGQTYLSCGLAWDVAKGIWLED